MGSSHYTRLLKAASSPALNVARDGAFTASLTRSHHFLICTHTHTGAAAEFMGRLRLHIWPWEASSQLNPWTSRADEATVSSWPPHSTGWISRATHQTAPKAQDFTTYSSKAKSVMDFLIFKQCTKNCWLCQSAKVIKPIPSEVSKVTFRASHEFHAYEIHTARSHLALPYITTCTLQSLAQHCGHLPAHATTPSMCTALASCFTEL